MQSLCEDSADIKYSRLIERIATLNKVAVAVSGGVDSSLLVKAAVDALGVLNIAAFAVCTEVTIKREMIRAQSLCSSLGVPLEVVNVSLLSNPLFVNNPPNRCYVCKSAMFTAIKNAAFLRGISCVLDGTNASDCVADRPGFLAVAELGIISPLRDAGLTKADVRTISRKLALATWDVPSNSCLATRFEHNYTLTQERLSIVEKAEDFLVASGITSVRVRVGGLDD